MRLRKLKKRLEDGGVLYLFNGTKSFGYSKITYSDKLYLLPNAEESFAMGITYG